MKILPARTSSACWKPLAFNIDLVFLGLPSAFSLHAVPSSLHHLTCLHEEKHFHISGLTGALHALTIPAAAAPRLPKDSPVKLEFSLALCDAPYLLAPLHPANESADAAGGKGDYRATLASRAIWLCRRQFYLARLWASFRQPCFDTAAEAIRFFRDHVTGDQSTLCLPRALFAAKTSRRFVADGVLFIGVFLPARSLHAWVIEGGSLADPCDDAWINYRPVAALT